MRRREVVALLGSAAVFAPGVEGKAQPRRNIAYLAPARTQHLIDAFQKGLRDLGYVEGRNITTDYYFVSERGQTPEATAADVVTRAPEAIVVVGVATATPAMRATTTIPIVFAPAGDPVRSGLVPSLRGCLETFGEGGMAGARWSDSGRLSKPVWTVSCGPRPPVGGIAASTCVTQAM